MSELIKQIPLVPAEILPKEDKKTSKVAQCNPKIYDRKHDLVDLEEWSRGMKKSFIITEVPKESKMTLGCFI